MINIIIPMAGRGERFANAGFDVPKPLIDVGGKPMITWVVDDLKRFVGDEDCRFIFIILREHILDYSIDKFIYELVPDCIIIVLNEVTKGAICTILKAEAFITNDPLIIANSDQHFVGGCLADIEMLDGALLTFTSSNPMCSFVRTVNGLVVEVKEKEVISDRANVGVYYFRDGKDFVCAAEDMIDAGDTFRDEFYVAPVYNYLIARDFHIGYLDVKMHGLGTPQDLKSFLDDLQRD